MATSSARWLWRKRFLVALGTLCVIGLDSSFVVGRLHAQRHSRWRVVAANTAADSGDLERSAASDAEDLWNIGLVHKNERNYKEAAPMLEQALEKWLQEDPEDDVTLAKLYDSVGSCYDEMGKFEKAVDVLQKAKDLYDGSIGTESYLYGSACERLTRALVHAGRYQEGLDNLIEAFTVIALQDAVHPTPLFELLGIALEEIPITEINAAELARLEVPIQAAVRNMHCRGCGQDGNYKAFFERMANGLALCGQAGSGGAAQDQSILSRTRNEALWRDLQQDIAENSLTEDEKKAFDNLCQDVNERNLLLSSLRKAAGEAHRKMVIPRWMKLAQLLPPEIKRDMADSRRRFGTLPGRVKGRCRPLDAGRRMGLRLQSACTAL